MSGENRTVVMSSVMLPAQANPHGNIHGGEVMKLMDSTAGCAAVKYCRHMVVTARVDEVQFLRPIHVGDFLTITARVVYVGTTSMEVYVTVDVENLRQQDSTVRALDAYFTIVAIGDDERPVPVPPYVPETEEDIALWHDVQARRDDAKARREAKLRRT
ncbi:MAG: acyl-CoA thioesterase [Propionibacteriaceae bacterium]|jgi:uncharacterized protein (TIGR00369 family)|nr:acyl-CoA thioesterase [Propionibacteriaceae bacterium]